MKRKAPNSRDFVRLGYGCVKHRLRDNNLDDAQLEKRCPLDNGRRRRHDRTPISTDFNPNQLDKLPVELLVEVLLLLDIPSITRFRSVNRRSMAIVNSVRQYAAIIKHCPNIIRAIVSLQADGYDCLKLYDTLSSTQCSTCTRFGNYLYLINCCRVCYFCYTRRAEYFPLTTHESSKFFTPDANSPRRTTARKLLESARPPSILSLPGRYCCAWMQDTGGYRPKRIRLYDRRSVDVGLSGVGLPGLPDRDMDRTTREPKRYMSIISAPLLLDGGRRVDHGFFCLGCSDKNGFGENDLSWRTKYTTEEMADHIAQYGIVETIPRYPQKHRHALENQIAL